MYSYLEKLIWCSEDGSNEDFKLFGFCPKN
jgi:hypothetical protein